MRDLALALRGARRRPFLTTVVVATLTLGIGLTTVVFSVADRVLFRELPYHEPERLVAIATTLADRPDESSGLAAAPLQAVMRDARAFASLATYRGGALVLAGPEGPVSIIGSFVSPSIFEVLGVPPLAGRGFTAAPMTEPPPREVVLSHDLWQTLFDGDPAVVGRSVTISDVPHTVVGVMPVGFVFPLAQAEAWVPSDFAPFLGNEERSRRQRWFATIGRLAPGATLEDAQRELTLIAGRLATELPLYHANERLKATALREQVVQWAAGRVRLLFGAGVLLLVVACANAASVVWAQVLTRRGEFAVRAALGASRPQVARQLVFEGLVLAAIGGAAGLALAPVLAAALRPLTEPFLPAVGLPSIDARIVLVALAACLACGLLLGLLPSLFVQREGVARLLRSGGRGGGGDRADSRVRATLVVVQTSLCVALLVSAGLLGKSLWRLQGTALGFDTSSMLTFQLNLPASRYAGDEAVNRFYDTLEERLRALPGVVGVAHASGLPMAGGTMASVGIDGRPAPDGQLPQSAYFSVSEEYFRLLRIPLREGRLIDPRTTAREVVINETMARRFWPDGGAIGARVRLGPVQTGPWITVVGIVADMRDLGPAADSARPIAFGANRVFSWPGRGVMLRTSGPPAGLAAAVRRTIASLDAGLVIRQMRTYDEIRSENLRRERASAVLLGLFSGGALLLALVGIYGLTAAFVAARTREFAIRMALGARPRDVVGAGMRRGLALTALGLAIGLAASAAITRVFASLIHGVRPYDTTVYALVSVTLAGAALLATWVPSRRATRVDPALALRGD